MSGAKEGTHIEDFLNPKSMPTPAAAGAIVSLIAGALFKNFGLSVAFCTIALSFLIGLIVFQSREFKSKSSSIWSKGLLYIINSLIIFAMATGTTSVMANDVVDQKRPLFYDWTKQGEDASGLIKEDSKLTGQDYEIKVELVNGNKSKIKSWLENTGILTKEYQAKISLLPKNKEATNKVKNVEIYFPEKELDYQKVKLNPESLSDGVNINAWKGFPVEAEITTESGEKIKLYKYINPEKITNGSR